MLKYFMSVIVVRLSNSDLINFSSPTNFTTELPENFQSHPFPFTILLLSDNISSLMLRTLLGMNQRQLNLSLGLRFLDFFFISVEQSSSSLKLSSQLLG